MPSRPLAPDAVVINGKAEPLLLNGGHVVKSLSLAFLADLQEDWVAHGKDVFRVLRRSHPQAYFGGLVALAKMIRWETTEEMLSDGGMTPDEIMDKLEERVGPEGRKLFERFRQRVDDPERGIAERDSVLTSHLHPLFGHDPHAPYPVDL